MLLSKAVLGLAKLAPQEESRYSLGAVAVEKDCATVTNGHFLVTIGHNSIANNTGDYPTIPAEQRKPNGSETILVARDACLGALKAIKALGKRLRSIPILNNAALSTDGKLYVNAVETSAAFKYETEGKFPNWRAVIPTEAPSAEVSVSAEYLRSLADYILEHCESRGIATVRLTVYPDGKPLRFDARTDDGSDVTALLMPVRTDSSSFAARPDQAEPSKAA